jgi:CRISPR type III-A-associated protein Csm2
MDMKDAMKKAGVSAPGHGPGYFDNAGHLRPEFVAKENVDNLARRFDRDGLNMHQLRRFFNYCREIERRLRSESSWEAERINVAKLSAFAADAAGKKPAKIPPSFREFLDKNVEQIHSRKDFLEGFMEHFEALVGFSALYLKEERQR